MPPPINKYKELTTTARVKRSSAAIIKAESCFYYFNGTLTANETTYVYLNGLA